MRTAVRTVVSLVPLNATMTVQGGRGAGEQHHRQMCQCRRSGNGPSQQVLTLVVVRVVPHQGRLSRKDGVTPGDELRSRTHVDGHES